MRPGPSRVLSSTGTRPSLQVAHPVRALVRRQQTDWQRVTVRASERGALVTDFHVRPVWTLAPDMTVRPEWLVIRRDLDGKLTYVLLNAPPDTPAVFPDTVLFVTNRPVRESAIPPPDPDAA